MSINNCQASVLYLAIALLVAGCIEQVDWELSPGENGALVVEAVLTNEQRIQSLKLSTSYNNLNENTPTIADAIVKVSSFADEFNFSPVPNEPGFYQSDLAFACQKDVPYFLEIEWDGKSYSSNNSLSFVAPFEEITFTNIADSDSFEIQQVAPLYHPLEQAYFELNLDWRHIIPGDSSLAKMYFYTFNAVSASALVRPTQERILFPRGTFLYAEKIGMNDGFANYMQALVSEVTWKGGVFDEASSSLPTNIEGGGLGYFAVCAVLRDTVLVE